MQYLIYFNIIIIIIGTFILYKNKNKLENIYIQKRKQQLESEVEKEIAIRLQHRNDLDLIISERSQTLQQAEERLNDIRDQQEKLAEKLESYEEKQKQYIDNYIEIIKETKTNEALAELDRQAEKRRQAQEESFKNMIQSFENIKKEKQEEIDEISATLDAFRAKQEAINEEILRRRELEEKTDFYRICLSDEAIADITELQIVKQKLKKSEFLDKIIYDTYVAKPVLEMVKRVLQNSTCSGIYKITCQETKEIYIGKSTDIKNRWQQHCKAAFNCGTIASSLLHRKMQQYGIENFTFELLETVPKDKLSEREKFYIDFYKTKETGLNERSG